MNTVRRSVLSTVRASAGAEYGSARRSLTSKSETPGGSSAPGLLDSIKYCRDLVKSSSPDVYQHILLQAKRDQVSQYAVRAFAAELSNIASAAPSAQLAQMRVQWWGSALDKIRALIEAEGASADAGTLRSLPAEALPRPPAHPVVFTLANVLRDRPLPFVLDMLGGMAESKVGPSRRKAHAWGD